MSKFSRGSMPPDHLQIARACGARAKAARSAKLVAIMPRLKFYPGYGPVILN